MGLTSPQAEEYFFPPPAMALGGALVAFAFESFTFPDEVHVTRLWVVDLAQRRTVRRRYAGKGHPKVGSVVVNKAGAVAWITCPADDDSDYGSLKPTCVRAGALDRVYVWDTGETRARVVDKSRKIDPRSLRRSGDVVSWVRDGKRHRARLH